MDALGGPWVAEMDACTAETDACAQGVAALEHLTSWCRDRKANNPDVVGSGSSRRQHLSLTLRNELGFSRQTK